MADQLEIASPDFANLRQRLEEEYEEELRSLKAKLEIHDKELKECHLQREKDAKEVREANTELERLRQEKADVLTENEALKHSVAELQKAKEDKEEGDAKAFDALLDKLVHESEEIYETMAHIPHLARYEELELMYRAIPYNQQFKLDLQNLRDSRSTIDKMASLVDSFTTHSKGWMEAIRGAGKTLTLLESAFNKAVASIKENPLFLKGVETRLRFWEHSKTEYIFVAREDLDQDRIERGNIAAHEPNVQADVELFKRGFLEGEAELAHFQSLYSKDVRSCNHIARRFPNFCDVLDLVSTIFLKIEDIGPIEDSNQWREWRALLQKMWGDMERLSVRVVGDDELFEALPEFKSELERLRELTTQLRDMEKLSRRR